MPAGDDKPTAGFADLRSIEAFLYREAQLLDAREFEAWRDLFTEDGHYWVPLRRDQSSPDGEASLFYDDRKIMATRFERLRHPNIHSQNPPHRTCHVIGNIVVESIDEVKGECVVASNMIMTDYRQRISRTFSGRVHHHLRRDEDGFRIVLKKVELINCDDVFEVVAVPF